MPSFDAARLHAMAGQLVLVTRTADWERLGQLDLVIRRWIEEAMLSTSQQVDRSAWQMLAKAHADALQACSHAREEAAIQLRSLQHSQEAQKAYAWQEILG